MQRKDISIRYHPSLVQANLPEINLNMNIASWLEGYKGNLQYSAQKHVNWQFVLVHTLQHLHYIHGFNPVWNTEQILLNWMQMEIKLAHNRISIHGQKNTGDVSPSILRTIKN